MRRWIVVVFGVVAVAGLVPAVWPQGPRRAVAPVRLDAAAVASAWAALDGLVVADRVGVGDDRGLLGDGWSVDADGCTTRQVGLLVERVAGEAAGCVVVDGVWLNWCDGRLLADVAVVAVDALVPSAHPWEAGARPWRAPRRVALADDVTTAATLTAVSAVQNQAEGAAPPDAWQPADAAARCRYAVESVTVKSTRLTVSATEREVSLLERRRVEWGVAP